ncbi:MAG: NUDIX hydrolase [Candidatus Marsarchaeota archaeon]|jgi:ADP-ribose pyrophosphatase YjhB (NUDIX family)|nr:NUDIX hydrolase [Candidatus Marsarchaeota archaeon]
MVKSKLGDTSSFSTKIKNFFLLWRRGFRPRIGVLYHPKTIRINKNYTKIILPSPQPGIREEWTKRIRTNISVKARYKDRSLPCNFKVENEDTCSVYLRKPHSKQVLLTLKIPNSDLIFDKKVYKEKGWLHVDYVVEIKKLSESNTADMSKYLSLLNEYHSINQIIRRRGTAIVDTPNGILVASHHKTWLLPGGGANKGESREKAAIRELREETGLKATKVTFLFEYNEPDDGRKIRNLHKVFLIEAKGTPKPNHHDVHHLAYWMPDSGIQLSRTTKTIVDKYINEVKK